MTELVNDKLTEKPVDAATVILLREQDNALQTLLLCRGKSRTVMNSAWVFPGGKVDAADHSQSSTIAKQLSAKPQDLLNEQDLTTEAACALFAAACRETNEETGVVLKASDLQTWSRWITPNEPSMMKKRFDARFFVAAMPHGQTAVHDGTEATDSAWYRPVDALNDYVAHNIVLAPPQIMSLLALVKTTTVNECLTGAANTLAYKIQPRAMKSDTGRTLVYPGDKDHPEPEQHMPGPSRLVWTGEHFEPPGGFDQYFN